MGLIFFLGLTVICDKTFILVGLGGENSRKSEE